MSDVLLSVFDKEHLKKTCDFFYSSICCVCVYVTKFKSNRATEIVEEKKYVKERTERNERETETEMNNNAEQNVCFSRDKFTETR